MSRDEFPGREYDRWKSGEDEPWPSNDEHEEDRPPPPGAPPMPPWPAHSTVPDPNHEWAQNRLADEYQLPSGEFGYFEDDDG